MCLEKPNLHVSWSDVFKEQFKQDYFKTLQQQLEQEIKNYKIAPQVANIFKAFDLCSLDKLKTVILGQDPYSAVGQAHGLSFSVEHNILPPSLKIYSRKFKIILIYLCLIIMVI